MHLKEVCSSPKTLFEKLSFQGKAFKKTSYFQKNAPCNDFHIVYNES